MHYQQANPSVTPQSGEKGPLKPVNHAPAPWSLSGQGIILVYKFRRQWVEECALLDPYQSGQFKGGLGYVMLVDYHHSPVGPYRELLIIPGSFAPHARHSISRIFVSSQASTDNGRYNWGIPKVTQPIHWNSRGRLDRFIVGSDSNPFFYGEFQSVGFPFPITTRLLPIRLYQEMDGRAYTVNPVGSGWAKFARVKRLEVYSPQFPDICRAQHLVCLKINPFKIQFPESLSWNLIDTPHRP